MTSSRGEVAPVGTTRESVRKHSDRIRENCDYSSQGHFEAANLYRCLHYTLGFGSVGLAALASGVLLYPTGSVTLVGGLMAILSAVIAGTTTLLRPSETSVRHQVVGNEYLEFRNQAIATSCLDLSDPTMTDQDLLQKVRDLDAKVTRLNGSPGTLPTPRWAYRRAKDNIRRGQTRNRVD